MDILTDKVPVVLGEAMAFRAWSDDLGKFDLPTPDAFAGVHKSAFADQGTREYPLTSRELVFFGAIHYRGRGGNDPEVLSRFSKAAAAHGVDTELAHYEPFFQQSLTKVASEETTPEIRVALRVKTASEATIEAYPLTCAEDIRPAADNASRDFIQGRLPLPLFGQAAREIVKAAAEFGVENLPAMITEAGVVRVSDPDQIARHIPADAPAELRDGYEKLAACAAVATDAERDILANAWDTLDGVLQRQRPRDQGTPYGVLWGGAPRDLVVKAAKEFLLFDKLGSHTLVPRVAVASLDLERAKHQLRATEAGLLDTIVKEAADSTQDPNVLLIAQDATTQRRLLNAILAATS